MSMQSRNNGPPSFLQRAPPVDYQSEGRLVLGFDRNVKKEPVTVGRDVIILPVDIHQRGHLKKRVSLLHLDIGVVKRNRRRHQDISWTEKKELPAITLPAGGFSS